MSEINIDNYLDSHYIHRSNWLRAAVLGANDGIISVSSLAIGVAAASSTREPIILATVAGLVAGALSIYEQRGLKKETALIVAKELTAHNALAAHVRDELGINEITQANPIQAALASGAAFSVGGVFPLLVILFAPLKGMEFGSMALPFLLWYY